MSKEEYYRLEISENLRRKMVEIARQFRKTTTPSEALLWKALRGKKVEGIKFRRQQPIGPFIVDFYAPAYRLVVEVDGPIHDKQYAADRDRQEFLESLGLQFLRLSASRVENDLSAALADIRFAIHNSKASPYPCTFDVGAAGKITPFSPGGRRAGDEGE